jgi:hypothetical protein
METSAPVLVRNECNPAHHAQELLFADASLGRTSFVGVGGEGAVRTNRDGVVLGAVESIITKGPQLAAASQKDARVGPAASTPHSATMTVEQCAATSEWVLMLPCSVHGMCPIGTKHKTTPQSSAKSLLKIRWNPPPQCLWVKRNKNGVLQSSRSTLPLDAIDVVEGARDVIYATAAIGTDECSGRADSTVKTNVVNPRPIVTDARPKLHDTKRNESCCPKSSQTYDGQGHDDASANFVSAPNCTRGNASSETKRDDICSQIVIDKSNFSASPSDGFTNISEYSFQFKGVSQLSQKLTEKLLEHRMDKALRRAQAREDSKEQHGQKFSRELPRDRTNGVDSISQV